MNDVVCVLWLRRIFEGNSSEFVVVLILAQGFNCLLIKNIKALLSSH